MAAANASVHAFLDFIQPALCIIFFPSQWLLFHVTIVETMHSGESCRNDYHHFGKNIDRVGDQTSDLLFSSPVLFSLSYEFGFEKDRQRVLTKNHYAQAVGIDLYQNILPLVKFSAFPRNILLQALAYP